MEVSSITSFYLIFELINIIIYVFIGVNSFNTQNFKSNIIYFLVGFISSLVFLLGLYYKLNNNWDFYGDILVTLALFLKIGAFPFSFWVIPVYNNLSNASFLFFITYIKLNYLIIFSWIFIKFINTYPSFTFILYSSIGTLFIGAFLLARQTTLKGFLASSSILNLPLWFITFYTFSTIFANTITYSILSLRLIFYLYLYTNIYILTSLFSFLIWTSIHTSKLFPNYNKNFLQPLFFPLTSFKDNFLAISLWILGGFPPFILFLLKFYLLYYSIWIGNIYITFTVLFILNSLGLYGYAKVLTSLFIRLKITYN